MKTKVKKIKNKIIIGAILLIIFIFSSPFILNYLIIKSSINQYSNIAKEYVYNNYGLNYHVKSVESSIAYPILADLMGLRVYFTDEDNSMEFFIDVKNDKVVYDSYGKF